MQGCPPALPYSEMDCGMPLDSLAALELYVADLAIADNDYAAITELCVEMSLFGLGSSPEIFVFVCSRVRRCLGRSLVFTSVAAIRCTFRSTD